MKRFLLSLSFLTLISAASAQQLKWYKFSKAFVEEHYQADGSAIGILKASASHPAKNVHPISCDGKDGELHIGIPGDAVEWSGQGPVSGFAAGPNSDFGIVAEPPNVTAAGKQTFISLDGKPITFFGYFRVWNEGHDVGAIAPSNPHHVFEVHPIWAIHSGRTNFGNPKVAGIVHSIPGFSGYGASKFGPVLSSVTQWLKVAEDNQFVYVQLAKADNFYQLPVVVKSIKPISGGAEAVVDVYAAFRGQPRLVMSGLHVIMASGSTITTQLGPNQRTYLLGFFSVNLKKAVEIARGHQTPQTAVSGSSALEFFAFGFPLQPAVSSSQCE